jgi:hypothetical protein
VRFDHESESFARLPCQNITESVGMARNISNCSQLCAIESDAGSLQECTPGIEGTQRHGKLVIAENAVDNRGVAGLRYFSIVDDTEL